VSGAKFDYRFMTVTTVTKDTICHLKSLRLIQPYSHETFSYSLLGIGTGDGLEGRGSNPSIGKIFVFSTKSRPTPETTQPSIQWVRGQFLPEVKWQAREATIASRPRRL
jgi:hypothetical protein